MQWHPLHVKTVEEGLSDILKQHSRTRHEIGDARIERIDVIIRIGCHIDQFSLTGLSIGTISHRRDTQLSSRRQLEPVGIRECLLIVGHGADFVMRFTIDRFGLSLSNDGDGLLNVGNGHLRPYPTHTGQNDNNG